MITTARGGIGDINLPIIGQIDNTTLMWFIIGGLGLLVALGEVGGRRRRS